MLAIDGHVALGRLAIALVKQCSYVSCRRWKLCFQDAPYQTVINLCMAMIRILRKAMMRLCSPILLALSRSFLVS